jgi:hypothetical protein
MTAGHVLSMAKVVAKFIHIVDFIFSWQYQTFHLQEQTLMKRFFRILLGSTLIWSCEPTSPEIGSDFFTDGVLDFTYIDSATVNLSTIQIDELTTSSSSRMLVGTHHDEQLGQITATPFFQVRPNGDVNFEDQNFAYDHLSLVLPLDHYFYYDTLLPLTLNVHRVTEDILTENGSIYNSNLFQIESNAIGTLTLKPKPSYDSVEVKLSDDLGREIFQKAINGSDELTNTNFSRYLRGFAIVPDTSISACFVGLETNPSLRLHYYDRTTTPISKKYVTFDVQSASGLFFTNITFDRKNTSLENMPSSREKITAAQTDGMAYIQAGAGLSLRVDLPYLRTLKQIDNFYIGRAVLEIYPVRKSFSSSTKLPSQLKVFKATKRNVIYEEIEAVASLIEDIDLGRDTYYRFDATEFVRSQMELQSLNENALVFTTDQATYPVSVDRMYAAAPGYEYKTRLRIYFATVNN